MYQSKLVASLKANGKILREFKDTVYIPFGSEYSFLIKNLNTQRAVVNIFIDGDDVVEGGLVLNAGQEVDLERYVKNGNLTEGNRFKFVERNEAIENGPRGIKLEDGLVRIEFQYEQPRPVLNRSWSTTIGSNNIYPQGGLYKSSSSYNVNGVLRSVDFSKNGATAQAQATTAVNQYCADTGIINKMEVHDGAATMDWMPVNDVGITVPGSKSEQKFTTVTMGTLEAEKHTIVLKLLGELANNKPVQKAVTVKAKQVCETCGHTNKATAKYCNKCGTALVIYA